MAHPYWQMIKAMYQDKESEGLQRPLVDPIDAIPFAGWGAIKAMSKADRWATDKIIGLSQGPYKPTPIPPGTKEEIEAMLAKLPQVSKPQPGLRPAEDVDSIFGRYQNADKGDSFSLDEVVRMQKAGHLPKPEPFDPVTGEIKPPVHPKVARKWLNENYGKTEPELYNLYMGEKKSMDAGHEGHAIMRTLRAGGDLPPDVAANKTQLIYDGKKLLSQASDNYERTEVLEKIQADLVKKAREMGLSNQGITEVLNQVLKAKLDPWLP